MKCKPRLREWLFTKIKEPLAMKKFHPNYLLNNLTTEETDLEEVLSNWGK
jgi:hypothetical protein